MAFTPYQQLVIRVSWTATPGTHGEAGTYNVDVINLRMPGWWNHPWQLFRIERPQFKSAIDEMRWAIDEVHARLHGSRKKLPMPESEAALWGL